MRAYWSDARFGDLRPSGPRPEDGRPLAELADRLRSGTLGPPPGPVLWIHQVHGDLVVVVPPGGASGPAGGSKPTGAVLAGTGDALVATGPGPTLVVLTADCASIALGSPEGVSAAVHAGWRGLVAGVIPSAVAAMRAAGADEVTGALGPCIHPECYEFGDEDLGAVARVLGAGVRGRTAGGRTALDLPAAVSSALAGAGVHQVPGADRCTACDPGYFSHRRRADRGRQALLVWSERDGGGDRAVDPGRDGAAQ